MKASTLSRFLLTSSAITFALLAWVGSVSAATTPIGTAFTYQGRLDQGTGPAPDGLYDFSVAAWSSATGGASPIGTDTAMSAPVTNGLFAVTLDFGTAFANTVWLEISVRTNAAISYALLSPRQRLTPAPYAVYAPSAGTAANFSGTMPGAQITDGSIAGIKIQNGTITAAQVQANTFWQLGGNTGTTPGTQFLGTTDNQPLEIKVNGSRVLRLEPGLGTAPNMVGGNSDNTVVSADGAVIGGGWANTVSAGSSGATIGGGRANTGGALWTTVGGGWGNRAEGISAFVGGGFYNTNAATDSTVAGGNMNLIQSTADWSVIGGGARNQVQSNSVYGAIAGGAENQLQGTAAQDSRGGFIGGGRQNVIEPFAYYSAVVGGTANRIQYDGDGATVAGGAQNLIGTNADYSTIGGGIYNIISNQASYATIPGGQYNSVGAAYGFAAGQRAKAAHPGAFVWADSTAADFVSTANNQFLIRANGNVGINKNNPATALDVNGTVTANGFVGNGSGLTGVSASVADNSVTASKLASDASSLNKVTAGAMTVVAGSPNFWGLSYLQDHDLQLRGDTFHGLGWYGAGKLYTGFNLNGPALYGADGGVLGTRNGATDTGVLYWNSLGRVGINKNNPATALDVNGTVTATSFSGSGVGLTGIQTAGLADGSVTLPKLAPNSVDSAKIVDLSVGTAELADGSVTSAKILDGTVATADLANLAVTTAKIADANVTLGKLAANSVDSAKIVDLSVGTADLADGSVTSAKILDGTVATADLANLAVTTAKIADANVTLGKLAANSVDASKIVDLSVGTAELADNAVASAKLANDWSSLTKVSQGGMFISGSQVWMGVPLRLNDNELYLRGNGGDTAHGLGWYNSSGRPFGSYANLDGAVLYGCTGGGLGSGCSGQKLALQWSDAGAVALDPGAINTGSLLPGLLFGGFGSAEGISSKRTAGTGQYGLDFYTAGAQRMTIANLGNVGIGTNNPQVSLHVVGSVRASGALRLGSETNTASGPSYPTGSDGLVIRRVVSTSSAAANLVAASQFMRLERDGSAAGLRIVIAANTTRLNLVATGVDRSGNSVTPVKLTWVASAGATATIFTDTQKVVHYDISFGNVYASGGHTCHVVADRFDDTAISDSYITGTLTSTFNQ